MSFIHFPKLNERETKPITEDLFTFNFQSSAFFNQKLNSSSDDINGNHLPYKNINKKILSRRSQALTKKSSSSIDFYIDYNSDSEKIKQDKFIPSNEKIISKSYSHLPKSLYLNNIQNKENNKIIDDNDSEENLLPQHNNLPYEDSINEQYLKSLVDISSQSEDNNDNIDIKEDKEENLYITKENQPILFLNYINTIQNNYTIQFPSKIENKKDLLSKANSLVLDQQGCRLLQKEIEEDNRISDQLFQTLYYNLVNISIDSFGNYLIQKLLYTISNDNLSLFTSIITNKLHYISFSTYGTRVVQKLIEVYSQRLKDKNLISSFTLLNDAIIANILQMSSDSNSSHIIIKYFNVIKYPFNIPLFNKIYSNFLKLSKDKHGCCVIQKGIEAGNDEQKNKFYDLSNEHCKELISDQFGNYVIQYVIGLNCDKINRCIALVVLRNLIHLCKEKYASNVIEKFLFNRSSHSKRVIEAIINDDNILHELILDQFGNYIVQRILTLVLGEDKYNIIKKIVDWYEEIEMLPYGPRLIAKLSERYIEFNILIKNRFDNKMRNFNFIQMKNCLYLTKNKQIKVSMKNCFKSNCQFYYPNQMIRINRLGSFNKKNGNVYEENVFLSSY